MPLDRILRYLARLLALAVALAALSLAAAMAQPPETVSLIYPATGFGAAILWCFGFRWWPALAIVQFMLSLRASESLAIASFVTAAEMLVIALFVSIVERLRVSREIDRLRDLGVFFAASLVATTVGGTLSAIGERTIVPSAPLREILLNAVSFWLSDFVSLLVFVPLVVCWRRWPFRSSSQFRNFLWLSLLLLALGGPLTLGGHTASLALFLLLPVVVFTSLVAGLAGTAAAGTFLLFILLGLHVGTHPTPVESMIRVLFVGTATATGYVLAVIWRERERASRRLFHLAHHDALTGVANRNELERKLEALVTSGAPLAHALLYLDLDQFKLVNDTCGHMAGDRMLQELSAELRAVTPAGSLLARLGGDEFVCLLPDAAGAEEAARLIHETAARYRFRFGAMSFSVGVSIGITVFPAEGGDTASAVLGRADIACHLAKENGGHRSHSYRPLDHEMVRWHSSMQEVSQLERAIENGRLRLYRQRIVGIDGGPPGDFHEVLLRFVHDGVVRTSAEFLPLAQRFGLMDRIDRWVFETTCRHLAESGDRHRRLSVNLSGSTLDDPSFYEDVVEIQKKYGVDPHQICLEVTEGVMIHHLRRAVEAMKGLRARGFDLALDDFGAGVASFAYLQELPVTYVKLDGAITTGLSNDPASEVIVGSLVRLASLRNIECIAEWVENEETLTRLRALGVRFAQGFYIEEPVPLA